MTVKLESILKIQEYPVVGRCKRLFDGRVDIIIEVNNGNLDRYCGGVWTKKGVQKQCKPYECLENIMIKVEGKWV